MLSISKETSKEKIFDEVRKTLADQGLIIEDFNIEKPWGGYFVIRGSQAPEFIRTFFPHLNLNDFKGLSKLSPKILLVAPQKRLSWQYHHRRSEIWKVIRGKVAVAVSASDKETEADLYNEGRVVELEKGIRHRLIGLENWGIVAEIWKHTDPENPSDENDIVRVQDDFGR